MSDEQLKRTDRQMLASLDEALLQLSELTRAVAQEITAAQKEHKGLSSHRSIG